MQKNPVITAFLSAAIGFAPLTFAAAPIEGLARANGQELPSLAPMLEQVTPAVVNIATKGHVQREDNPLMQDPFFRRFFNIPEQRERPTQSLGSGVIVDAKNGYIITNNHVIDKAEQITVTLRDRRQLSAKLIGTDPETDIAVIQVPAEHLNALKLFDTSKLRVGDYVVAIGNPFGLGQTVTSGIVSALGRSGLGIEGIEDFIQTDASINPGNSGGALVNLRGELIGINTAILSPGGGGNVGIGFAIPVNMVREIMDQLVQYGEVKRGRLGVAVQDLTPDLANAFNIELREGAVIAQVVDGSPAAIAGLKAGDVVTKINDRHVTNSSDLRNAIGLLRVGQKVNLTITRNRSEKTLVATITAPKIEKVDAGKLSPKLAGATLGLSELETVENGLVKAVTIVELGANSPAARAGLRKGDIILSVNRQVVKNFDEFKSALKNNSRGLLLNIQRGENAMFLLLQ